MNLYLKCFQSAENQTVLQSPWSRRLLPGPTCPWCDLPSEQGFLSQTQWQGVLVLFRTMFAWDLFIWHHLKFCWNFRFAFMSTGIHTAQTVSHQPYLTNRWVIGCFHHHSFYCLQWYNLQTLVYNEILKVFFQNHKVWIFIILHIAKAINKLYSWQHCVEVPALPHTGNPVRCRCFDHLQIIFH